MVHEKDDDLEDKSKIIEELEARIAELERGAPVVAHTTSTTNADVSVPLVSEAAVSAVVETDVATTSAMKMDTVDAAITTATSETSETATMEVAEIATPAAGEIDFWASPILCEILKI